MTETPRMDDDTDTPLGDDDGPPELWSESECAILGQDVADARGARDAAQRAFDDAKDQLIREINEHVKEQCGFDFTDLNEARDTRSSALIGRNAAEDEIREFYDGDLGALESQYREFDEATGEYFELVVQMANLGIQNALIDDALTNPDGTSVDPVDFDFASEDDGLDLSDAQGDTPFEQLQSQREANEAELAALAASEPGMQQALADSEEALIDLVGSPDAVDYVGDWIEAKDLFEGADGDVREINDAIDGVPPRDGQTMTPGMEFFQADFGLHPDLEPQRQARDAEQGTLNDLEGDFACYCVEPEPVDEYEDADDFDDDTDSGDPDTGDPED